MLGFGFQVLGKKLFPFPFSLIPQKKGADSMLEDRKVELTALRDRLNEMGDSL